MRAVDLIMKKRDGQAFTPGDNRIINHGFSVLFKNHTMFSPS